MPGFLRKRDGILFLPEGLPNPGDLGSEVRAAEHPVPDDAVLRCRRCGIIFDRHSEEVGTTCFCNGCKEKMNAMGREMAESDAADGNLPKDCHRVKGAVVTTGERGWRPKFSRKDTGS